MVSIDRAELKKALSNTVNIATVYNLSAAYATSAISSITWLGRKVTQIGLNDLSTGFENVTGAIKDAHLQDLKTIDFPAVGEGFLATAKTVVDTVKDTLFGTVGLATLITATVDSVIDSSCDAIEKKSAKKEVINKFVREPAKLACASAIYYAVGAPMLPAAGTYAAYRLASHFGKKIAEKTA